MAKFTVPSQHSTREGWLQEFVSRSRPLFEEVGALRSRWHIGLAPLCLGMVNSDGHPRHPLFVPYAQGPEAWGPPR